MFYLNIHIHPSDANMEEHHGQVILERAYPVIDSGKTGRTSGKNWKDRQADNDPSLFKALQNSNTGGEINPFLIHPSLV